jgi:hypothetical protein
MATASTTQEQDTSPTGLDPTLAVLYVCAERGHQMPGLALQRAEHEGRAFAAKHGLKITEVIADLHGTADPCQREGWLRVRDVAAAGAVGVVIVRWPAVIAPDPWHELRYREIRWLMDRGVRVCYSWAPLAAGSGEIK